MKVDNGTLTHCENDIFTNVLRYAYENASVPPLVTESDVTWHGEIFETKNILDILFRDTTVYLKKEGIYNKIIETTDKFIILPDVFSEQLYPKSFYHFRETDVDGIRDYGIPNIVIVNGYVFELINEQLNGIAFCYNGKYYYFYDSSNEYSKYLESETPSFKVYHINKYTEFDFNEKYPIGTPVEGSYTLQIGLDNKVLIDESPENYLTLKIDYPYVVFNYDERTIRNKSSVVGLHSNQPLDTYIQEKIFDEMEDKFIMHERNASFCETAIVVNKDNTYRVVNDSFSVELNRIDKHTVEFYKNSNVKEIVVFYKPVLIEPDVQRVDSLYDDVMTVSDYGFYDLRYYTKSTTYLYNWMISKYPTVEELVNYGYERDADVLRAIQMIFPTKLRLDQSYLHVSKKDPNGNVSTTNQLFLSIPNNILLRPIIFIDGIMFDSDTSEYNRQKLTVVHLNMTKFDPEINRILKTSLTPQDEIRELFKNKTIDVALLSDIIYDNKMCYFKEYKQALTSTPAAVISNSELKGNVNSTFFINGRASIGINHDSLLYTTPVYDFGMSTDLKASIICSKFKADTYRFVKMTHIEKAIELTYTKENQGLFNLKDKFTSAGFLVFDQNGILNNSKLEILTSDYATFSETVGKYPDRDSASLRFIKLPKLNVLHGIDLEIDESLINTVTNVGTYNERSIAANPNILEYFKTGEVFQNSDYDVDLFDATELKTAMDCVATYGSVGVTPFNTLDYKMYLDVNNITAVDNYNMLPLIDKISDDFKSSIRYHRIAQKLFSNIWFAKNLETTETLYVMPDLNLDYSMNNQMNYYINKGILSVTDVGLIMLDTDLNMELTDDFLNPEPVEPYENIKGTTISLNYALDKQAHMTTTTKTVTLDD